MTSDVLDEAYVRLHRWGPEFGAGNGLSNHAPMAVEVLTRRGYDDQVDSWLDRYVARLEALPEPDDPITEDNWTEAMGQRRRAGDWVAFFRRAVREATWPAVLADVVASAAAGHRVGGDAWADPDRARGPHGSRRRHLAERGR